VKLFKNHADLCAHSWRPAPAEYFRTVQHHPKSYQISPELQPCI